MSAPQSESLKLESLEIKVARFLRFGTMLAGVMLLIGWIATMHGLSGNPFLDFAQYKHATLIPDLELRWNEHQWGALVAYVGLFVLISLPLIRVFMTAVLFIRSKEYVLASLASFVVIVLLASFFLGFEL